MEEEIVDHKMVEQKIVLTDKITMIQNKLIDFLDEVEELDKTDYFENNSQLRVIENINNIHKLLDNLESTIDYAKFELLFNMPVLNEEKNEWMKNYKEHNKLLEKLLPFIIMCSLAQNNEVKKN